MWQSKITSFANILWNEEVIGNVFNIFLAMTKNPDVQKCVIFNCTILVKLYFRIWSRNVLFSAINPLFEYRIRLERMHVNNVCMLLQHLHLRFFVQVPEIFTLSISTAHEKCILHTTHAHTWAFQIKTIDTSVPFTNLYIFHVPLPLLKLVKKR